MPWSVLAIKRRDRQKDVSHVLNLLLGRNFVPGIRTLKPKKFFKLFRPWTKEVAGSSLNHAAKAAQISFLIFVICPILFTNFRGQAVHALKIVLFYISFYIIVLVMYFP